MNGEADHDPNGVVVRVPETHRGGKRHDREAVATHLGAGARVREREADGTLRALTTEIEKPSPSPASSRRWVFAPP